MLTGKRKVQRVSVQLPATPSIIAYWMWCEFPGQFVPYHTDATVDIELAFQNKVPQVDLSQKPSKLPYTIDFVNLIQTRHHYNTRRAIQRVTLPAGTSLQQLLQPAPTLASGVATGASHSGSGSGVVLGMPGVVPGTTGLVLGATPHYGSGLMPGTTPTPNSYGVTPLTGFGSSAAPYYPGPPAGHAHPIMGHSHTGVSHLGYLGHTASGLAPGLAPSLSAPHTPSSTYIASTASISGHSSTISNSSTPLAPYYGSSTAIPSGSTSTLMSNPPAAATRSKTGGSQKTAKAASASVPKKSAAASVPKKSAAASVKSSGKGRSRTKAQKPPTSSHVVGGASNHGDDLSAYARRVTRLRAKSDGVSTGVI